MACFADINVLQGSVATCARSGGILNIQLGPNYKFTRNSSSEKTIFNRFRFGRIVAMVE